MQKRRPLILSPWWDIQAAAVCWGLEKNGINPYLTASLADAGIGPLSLYASGRSAWQLQGGIDGCEISSVWYLRPRKPKKFPEARSCDTPCLETEWSRFHNNVYVLSADLGESLWVTRPDAALRADSKLVQLRCARQCGLAIPETLVSNDPQQIRNFISTHGRVVYKGFSRYTWKNAATGKMYAQWVDTLSTDTLPEDEVIRMCPGTYQACIDKQCDLRVTVIGERLFAVRLEPVPGRPCVDWRRDALTQSVEVSACSLPAGIEAGLRCLMKKLGIVYGCIDLVVDASGDYYFLEVNQAGAFSFVEDMQESMPLLRAMCAMLATGRCDYPLAAISDVSYHGFINSDAYHVWSKRVEDPEIATQRIGGVMLE